MLTHARALLTMAALLAMAACSADDTPTAIQIYGSDPQRLTEAAEIAERAQPTYVDVNCGW